MTLGPVPSPEANSASSNHNPYASFRCCCTTLHIREHAQLCAVLSFTLFLCLVVLSLFVFGSLSIFYIIVGVVVYSLLLKGLFGVIDKLAVLFYLLFEAIQIGFYLALVLYVALPLLFMQISTRNCYEGPTIVVNGTIHRSEICDEPQSAYQSGDYLELLLFVTVLLAIKLYFARVFAHFYKYLVWNDRMSLHRAHYINGSGIQISIDRPFPAPPSAFWNNHIVRDRDYGYDVPNLGQMPVMDLPSYAQVIGQQTAKGTIAKEEGCGGGNADSDNDNRDGQNGMGQKEDERGNFGGEKIV